MAAAAGSMRATAVHGCQELDELYAGEEPFLPRPHNCHGQQHPRPQPCWRRGCINGIGRRRDGGEGHGDVSDQRRDYPDRRLHRGEGQAGSRGDGDTHQNFGLPSKREEIIWIVTKNYCHLVPGSSVQGAHWSLGLLLVYQ